MRLRRPLKFVAVITALAGAVTAVVLATPASGILSATVVARASFQDPVDIKFKLKDGRQDIFHAPNAGETVMQQIVIGPGGQTGWHSHPGPVVVLVKSGVVTFFAVSSGDACTPRNYSTGQAFIDPDLGHVNLGANLGTENVELWVTYFDVPPGGAFRIDAAKPANCPF